ncbi:MAG: biotin--[acetyl-CoA-carboxylase] ligase [Candidatus Limnocylindrales bacterium]
MTDFLARQERFDLVGSTNDVVRGWLADGTPEVCLAVADEQSAGRGRDGRRWEAPAGAALLLSLGFRPTWLTPDAVWRLAATTSLAMADAAEEVAGLPDNAIRLKWPNDLVIETVGLAVPVAPQEPDSIRKVAGVLGETEGLGTPDPRVVIGLGLDTDWAAADFPDELRDSMTSLREASHGRPIDHVALLDAFLGRLEVRIEALRGGRFDVGDWTARQVTTGPRGPAHRAGRHDGPSPGAWRGRPEWRTGHRGPGRREWRAHGPRRRDPACPPRQPGRGVTRWRARRSGEWAELDRPLLLGSSSSIGIARWWTRHRRIRPGSRPSIGSTWPRCTATRSTNSATTTTRKTRRNGRSCPR